MFNTAFSICSKKILVAKLQFTLVWTGPSKSLSGRPLHCLGMSRHFELMYNMGIQLLHCGKALPAFECLIEAVQIYHINPHLWLRLAECCIIAYREVCLVSSLFVKVLI